jgi:hypothetical protein
MRPADIPSAIMLPRPSTATPHTRDILIPATTGTDQVVNHHTSVTSLRNSSRTSPCTTSMVVLLPRIWSIRTTVLHRVHRRSILRLRLSTCNISPWIQSSEMVLPIPSITARTIHTADNKITSNPCTNITRLNRVRHHRSKLPCPL